MAYQYETVAVSQTDQVMGPRGAAGDLLDRVICVVATAASSSVSVKDGSGSAISILPAAVGGGVGTYVVTIGAISIAGAWSVTTGAGVTAIGVGRFT